MRQALQDSAAILGQTILELVVYAPDESVLVVVGAAPLEDFVCPDEDRVRWIEEQAHRSDKFRRALAGVRIWDQPQWVVDRVENAAGFALPRPNDGASAELPIATRAIVWKPSAPASKPSRVPHRGGG
jgi:hypothetical protein